jgi:rhodanese-related sulfurtransferase
MTDQDPSPQDQILYYQRKLQYEIDAWDLNEALQQGNAIVVIDTRSKEAYQNEHIPGAIHFPHRTMTKETTQHQLNFETLYVTYCDGIGCNASTKGALKLATLGYKVKELIGGIEWWKRDQYPTTNQASCLKQQNNQCGCG